MVCFFIQARREVAALPPAVFCPPKKTLSILQARREVAALPPAFLCHPFPLKVDPSQKSRPISDMAYARIDHII